MTYLRAPETFSLIENPEESIFLLNRMETTLAAFSVFVQFDGTTRLTSDAAMALVATMSKVPEGNISGNVPLSPECTAILIESGFFDHVSHGLEIEASRQGRIAQWKGETVDGTLAKEMIDLGTSAIYGNPRPSEASYRVLVEAMQNTNNHANPEDDDASIERPKEQWWVMVYGDRHREKVCFAFLDVGVGIFGSAKLKLWRRLTSALQDDADADVLKDLLDGQIESRTGLPHRGKGLPAMKQLSDRREIERFTIITNGVHASVDKGLYSQISNAFCGTLLYWEV